MAKVSQILGEQIFPERRILLQSSVGVRHVSLPGWLQAVFLVVCMIAAGGVAYLAVSFAHMHRALDVAAAKPQPTVDAAREPAVQARSAQLDKLRGQIAAMQQQLATVNQNYAQANADYEQTRQKLAALTAQNQRLQHSLSDANAHTKTVQEEADRRAKTVEQELSSKAGSATQLARSLEQSRSALQQSEAARTTLQNRVQELQLELQAANSRGAQDRRQLADEPPRPPAAEPPAALPPAAPSRPGIKPQSGMASVPHAANEVSKLKRVLASTGVDIDRLLRGLKSAPAEGGPYIALNDPRAAALDQQRLEDLKKVAKMLPLASPLDEYKIGSPFGARIDPFNHREGFHPGVDLDAPYKTPVYSTAPGTVIFTGTMEDYGRVVEIDHGHGIMTRYAHLHRILVARGEKVGLHTEIGELGSTGRSTGPHLHYEVHVDGVVVNPAKFMEAGKNVVQVSDK